MTNALQVFNYEGKQVRTVEHDGTTWFVAKDVAQILGYKRTADAVATHVHKNDKLTRQFTDSGQAREMVIINEPGVYALIFGSKLDSAQKFKYWVMHEVLPAIRKHGAYISDAVVEQAKKDPEFINALINRIAEEREKNRELREEIAKNRACTVLGQIVLAAGGCFTVQNAAQFLAQKGFKTGQNRLFKKLRAKHWLCEREGKQKNKPTQYAIEHGFLNLQIGEKNSIQVMVTPKALSKLADEFTKEEQPLIYIMDLAE